MLRARILAVLLSAVPLPAAAAECPVTGTASATVAEVIDGDTLRLADNTVVRLAGIEAPKPPLTVAAGEPWPLADAATNALRRLVEAAAVTVAPVGGGPDRHNRRHVYLFLTDGRSVAGEMVDAGLARVRWLPDEGACLGAFLPREEAARAAHRGLWASPDYVIRQARDSSLLTRNGLYELVEGKVVSVGRGYRLVFLDFGRNYQTDFTILISPSVAKSFEGLGFPLDGFANRRVRVRGVIEEAGGPAIRLNDPREIELLDDGGSVGDESVER